MESNAVIHTMLLLDSRMIKSNGAIQPIPKRCSFWWWWWRTSTCRL